MVVMNAKLCEYTKNPWRVYFKWVNCVLCEFYLNKAVKTILKKGNKRKEGFCFDVWPGSSQTLQSPTRAGGLSGMVAAPVRG